jgi:hypothetical protein
MCARVIRPGEGMRWLVPKPGYQPPWEREGYGPLTDRLASYMKIESRVPRGEASRKAGCRKSARPGWGRAVLENFVCTAIMFYDSAQSVADENAGYTLHELGEPLALLEGLRNDANRRALLLALSTPLDQSEKQAEDRLNATLRDLERIAAVVRPPPPAKLGPPVKKKDLDTLVDTLCLYWERVTGDPVKQGSYDKYKNEPNNNATKFVYDVVLFIDPKLKRSVRTSIAKFIHSRRG